jgi:hypothetical protein
MNFCDPKLFGDQIGAQHETDPARRVAVTQAPPVLVPGGIDTTEALLAIGKVIGNTSGLAEALVPSAASSRDSPARTRYPRTV